MLDALAQLARSRVQQHAASHQTASTYHNHPAAQQQASGLATILAQGNRLSKFHHNSSKLENNVGGGEAEVGGAKAVSNAGPETDRPPAHST